MCRLLSRILRTIDKRLQQVNGDTVLEITDTEPVKTRLSEQTLLRHEQYFVDAIAKFEAELAKVREKLAEIYAEKDKAQ